MKKVVVASLLAVASVAPVARMAVAQTQVNLGSNAQAAGAGFRCLRQNTKLTTMRLRRPRRRRRRLRLRLT